MKARFVRYLLLCIAAAFLFSCSSTPAELVAKHTKRGDEFAQKEKYKEAVIEYKNAVKAGPKDAALHYKLAKAALEAREFPTAYQELQKTVELDPGNYEAKAKLGEIYVASGKTDEAGQIADNLVVSRPQDPAGYILKAGIAARGGKVDEAIAQLKKAVELDPKAVRPILTIGNLYLVKRDRKSAMEWYDKALAAAPDAPEVHIARGNFFFAEREADEGEKEYRKAIELSKEKENLRIALAEQYLYQGRLEDAEKELNAVIKEMNSQKARKALAEIKIESGKPEEAKPLVDAILKENDKDLDGKYLKGRIALAEKRYEDARALFAEVIKQDAAMAGAHLYNGLTQILQGYVDVGTKEVQEAVKLAPNNVRARLVLGQVYLQSNAPAAAEQEAVEVLRRNPSNLQAAVLYGDSFLARKDWKKAEQVYGSMVKQMPKNPLGFFKMGLVRKFQGNPSEAAGYFAQAVERNPKDLGAVNEYLFALLAAKQPEKAKKVLDEYVAKEPKNPLLWETAGRVHLAMRQPAEAETAFLKAIELAPDFTQPYYQLGVLYIAQKKLPEADAKLSKVIEKNEKNVGAHTLLGVVRNSMGKIDEANKEYRRALELSPKNALAANNLASNLTDFGGNLDEALKYAQIARGAAPEDPNIADTLGWIYYKKGLFDTAYPLLSDAAKKLEKNAVVRYHYGMALSKKGKAKEAAAELKAALALNADFQGSAEAKKELAALK
jgi:tetratricopeptide (TPR) repeat protein